MPHTMESRVLSILAQYEEGHEAGIELSPEELCKDKPELVEQIREKLRLLHGFPSSPGNDLNTRPSAPQDEQTLPNIPGYLITHEINRGGMGRVLAGQELRLKREVAIKTLLPHADADRFVTEAQVTARLPHPSIPPVYALGTLNDGKPYLVMKLVRGNTLADELKARATPLHDLPRFVQIFEQIAQAVGFAHSEGILHRDLKPANIMVGAFGEVQVMDWGLAKLFGKHRGTSDAVATKTGSLPQIDPAAETLVTPSDTPREGCDSTVTFAPGSTADEHGTEKPCLHEGLAQDHTRAGVAVGTPAYMAPEQARRETLDPRADVFALGGILCAILTGNAVFLKGNNPYEVLDQAAAGDTADAFSRLETSGADDELVTIAKKCLEVNRYQRPSDGQAVAALVADYRLGVEARLKQAETEAARALVRVAEGRKRRRVWLGLAATLLVGVIASSLLALWANEARKDAEKAKEDERNQRNLAVKSEKVAKDERDKAQTEKNTAVAVRDFLRNNLLKQANVYEQATAISKNTGKNTLARHDVTIRDLLDRAAEEFSPENIQNKFPKQFAAQAEILETIGEAYEANKQFEQAIRFIKAATELRRKEFGEDNPATYESEINLAFTYLIAARQSDAVRLCISVIKRLEKQMLIDQPGKRGDASELAADAIIIALEKRFNLMRMGNFPDLSQGFGQNALAWFQVVQSVSTIQSLAHLLEKRFTNDDPRTIYCKLGLGFFYHAQGKAKDACAIYESTLSAAERKLAKDHVLTIGLSQVLAATYEMLGEKKQKAQELWQRSYDSLIRVAGPEHPATLAVGRRVNMSKNNATKDPNTKIDSLKRIRDSHAKMFGEYDMQTLVSANNLSEVLLNEGKYKQTIETLEPYYDLCRNAIKDNCRREHLTILNNLAFAYNRSNRGKEAIQVFEMIRAPILKLLGPNHVDTHVFLDNLALAYGNNGRVNEAILLFKEVYQARLQKNGPQNVKSIDSMLNLADMYKQSGDYSVSLNYFEQALKAQKQLHGESSQEVYRTLYDIANTLLSAKKHQEAVDLFIQIRTYEVKKLGENDLDTLTTEHQLAYAYGEMNRRKDAISHYEHVFSQRLQKLGLNNEQTLLTLNNMANDTFDEGQIAKAISMYEVALAAREVTLGKEDKDTLATMLSLASAYRHLSMYKESISLFERLFATRYRVDGAKHTLTIDAQNHLGLSFLLAGEFQQAEKHLLQSWSALVELEQSPDNWKQWYALRLACLYAEWGKPVDQKRWKEKGEEITSKSISVCLQESSHLLKAKRYIAAEDLLRNVLSYRLKHQPDQWSTFNTYSQLGGAVLGQGKHIEAEPLLLKGYEGMVARESSIPIEAKSRIPEALDRLIQLYTATNKLDEARKWQARKVKLQDFVKTEAPAEGTK